jgi:hypothetical protein
MLKENTDIRKRAIKKLLKYFRGRLTLLEKYRDIDIDKEILNCLNEIKKLKDKLKRLRKNESKNR